MKLVIKLTLLLVMEAVATPYPATLPLGKITEVISDAKKIEQQQQERLERQEQEMPS